MRIAMEEVAKKLTLWHTRTFRPILTHEELEPIMAAVGFVPLAMAAPPAGGGVAWREYAFCAAPAPMPGGRLPRPRLPFPRLDGVHFLAFQAFFEALEFYLGADEVPNLFHVRSMPITRALDRALDGLYRPMRDCGMGDEGIYVYREGTLDQNTQTACSYNSDDDSSSLDGNIFRHNVALMCKYKKSNSKSICLVSLAELFPSRDILSLG